MTDGGQPYYKGSASDGVVRPEPSWNRKEPQEILRSVPDNEARPYSSRDALCSGRSVDGPVEGGKHRKTNETARLRQVSWRQFIVGGFQRRRMARRDDSGRAQWQMNTS